jgi:tetrahydrodipicolinate N-succinyltransferase
MKTKITKPKKLKTRVTCISVGATYNLGNYENVRFDLSAEVGKGESALAVFQELRYIVACLRPARKPDCEDQFERVSKKTDAERSNYEKENFQAWADRMANYHLKQSRRATAIQMLDTLGGNRAFRDAKQKWEDVFDDDAPW